MIALLYASLLLAAPPDTTTHTTLFQSPAPIRSLRPWTVSGELGWNGLGGLGINVSYNLHPNFSIDTGLGLGLTGVKGGVRGRYNLLTSNLTPFFGLGALVASGWNDTMTGPSRAGDGTEFDFRIHTLPFVQMVGGLSYVADGGFAFMATVGYAALVRQNAIEIIGTTPTPEERSALNIVFGSGAVVSLAFGYAF